MKIAVSLYITIILMNVFSLEAAWLQRVGSASKEWLSGYESVLCAFVHYVEYAVYVRVRVAQVLY